MGYAVVAIGVVASSGMGIAQSPMRPSSTSNVQSPSAPSVNASNSAGVPTDEMLTSTVHEAWLASGRNEDKFFDMVKVCAAMSAQKRGITLPDTEAAGRTMGMAIKRSARRDPDQLLYAVVDAAVRQAAMPAKSTSASPAQ